MDILLGNEIPTGKEVNIPIRHMCVTGQTQNAGKTTTLEALIERSGMRSLAFITKRGEGAFNIGHQIQPFFTDGAGWQYVESLVEASLGEKNKFQRAWVQKACRNAKTLADVHKNSIKLQKNATRSMDEDQFMLLNSYLEIIVPQIAKLPKSSVLKIGPGLNVMDLTAYTPEMQMLVVRSSIEYIHRHENNTITIIPEAWKMVPEGKGSPVKPVAEFLIREGAGLKNFIWLDSQDIAGVSKILLRACTVWVIGVQREANEIKRTLDNIPAGIKQPTASEIAHLGIGQFYACFGSEVHKTYVQPAWMSSEDAKLISMGKKKFSDVAKSEAKPSRAFLQMPTIHLPTRILPGVTVQPPVVNPDIITDKVSGFPIVPPLQPLTQKKETNMGIQETLEAVLAEIKAGRSNTPIVQQYETTVATNTQASSPKDFPVEYEELFQIFKKRLIAESPVTLQVIAELNEIDVIVERKKIKTDGNSCFGACALLVKAGFFKKLTSGTAAETELKRTGNGFARPQVYKELGKLVTAGFLTKEEGGFIEVASRKCDIQEVK